MDQRRHLAVIGKESLIVLIRVRRSLKDQVELCP